MLKEIHEQPEALRQSLAGRVTPDGRIQAPEVDGLEDAFRRATRVELVACGTASYAALVGAAADPGLDRAAGPGHRRAPSSATRRRRSTPTRSSSR